MEVPEVAADSERWQIGRREFIGATLAGCLSTSAPAAVARSLSANSARIRNRITIILTGGASHLDLWDLKPSVSREIRGPFRPIATSVPGLHICEHLPRLAAQTHFCTLFRGMRDHGPEIHDLSGFQPLLGESIQLFPGPSSPAFSDESQPKIPQFTEEDRLRYGDHSFGRNALLARDLISHESTEVSIHFSAGILNTLSWDMHADGGDLAVNFHDVAWKLMPQLDQGLSALLSDLHQMGLLPQTVVSVVSEMGRTPHINPRGGRDHFKGAWSNLVAGGPFMGGNIIGETDTLGTSVISGACTPEEFCQRILSA